MTNEQITIKPKLCFKWWANLILYTMGKISRWWGNVCGKVAYFCSKHGTYYE